MKFALADATGDLTITAYARGEVVVGDRVLTASLVLLPDRLIDDWRPTGFDDLAPRDLAEVCSLRPDLILLGTGETQRFPGPALLHQVAESGVGFEVMTTPAACRTYNVLVSEGRRVAAALLL